MKSFILSLLIAFSLTACTDYGSKVKKDYLEVYYKDGISKELAQRTLDFLYPVWKNKSGTTEKKSIQLSKGNGDTINFRAVIDEKKAKEMGDDVFYDMANVFSDSIFNGVPVNIIFSTNEFKPMRTLVFKKQAIVNYGEKVTAGNIDVYAKETGTEIANTLATFLDKYIHPKNTISFQISKNEHNDFVVNMVSSEDKAGQLKQEDLAEICSKISAEVLNGSSFIFQLTDNKFNPLKTFAYPSDASKSDSLQMKNN
jgi:hypothetical protein